MQASELKRSADLFKRIKRKRLAIATLAYWFLLLYVIAALVWWFITLQNQSNELSGLQRKLIRDQNDPPSIQLLKKIETDHSRAHTKFLGEGITFFAIILIGAFFVYRSVRKQFLLQQQQQNLMMAITHELKTPIAVSKLNIETIQRHRLDEAKQEKLLQMTLQEINRLNNLTNNILVSAQLEARKHKHHDEVLDLSDLTISSVDDYKHRYPERTFQTTIEPDLDVKGDSLLLQILINNLIENAIKYSSSEAPISILLKSSGRSAQLCIIDQGPGIPDEEKKNVFRKFYRIGTETTRTTKGTGLGLYLVKKIAEYHHAYVKLSDNEPNGCNFAVMFHKLPA